MKRSAGLLLFRHRAGLLEVLLGHPGGPYWAKKDLATWSIPKGEYAEDETPLAAAQREFREETGYAYEPPFIDLGEVRQPGGKLVHIWACEGDAEPAALVSNSFEMEWPPKSGRMQSFPEFDRAAWFGVEEADRRILKGQRGFVERLVRELGNE
jgi:predicted NUDIX family NTP pyrophosphohydrolase